MSSFDTLERSTEQSRPIELFKFTIGATVYRYTSQASRLIVGADTWEPETIGRTSAQQGSDPESRGITITLPATNAVVRRFWGIPPGEPVEVLVLQLQRDEAGFATQSNVFLGDVQNVRFSNDGNSAEVSVKSIEVGLVQSVPRVTFMASCNNFLYDERCTVDPSLHNVIGEVTAVSTDGRQITVTGVAASGKDFVGGYARPAGTNDYRTVLAQSGDVLTLLYPFEATPLGVNVQAFRGCDHDIEGDCATVFDNVLNFNGTPGTPNFNPFATKLPTT